MGLELRRHPMTLVYALQVSNKYMVRKVVGKVEVAWKTVHRVRKRECRQNNKED
jgi:hypothetical protein